MVKKDNKDIEKLSFEESLAELEDIVRRLEQGGANLDASIEDYTRGTALKKHAEKKLKEAKLKVEKIIKNSDGDLDSEPIEIA